MGTSTPSLEQADHNVMTKTEKRASSRLPSLDGWRMVSISLVLFAHSVYTASLPVNLRPLIEWFEPGPLGVDFFFEISGFLITWLLLREQRERGAIRLKDFYVRRALRILPVYFLYLFVLGFFTHFTQPVAQWVANVTFTTDFFETGYGTAHLWSLGVEEQFYLLWPCLLIWALRRGGVENKLLKILLAPVIVAPVVRLIAWHHWYSKSLEIFFQEESFFHRFDSLAYGCIAAVLLAHRRAVVESFLEKNARDVFAGGLVLILLPPTLQFLPRHETFVAMFGHSMQAAGFSLLLVQSIVAPQRGVYRFLNWKWVSHIGVLSYSIYIWQEMFCGADWGIFAVKNAWWEDFPFWIVSAVVVAHVSFYLVERPFMGLRARYRAV